MFLKGDMRLIGPRPLLMEYIPLYTPKQAGRHEVKPGITGWAQVNGRNALTWEQKFEHDLWCVKVAKRELGVEDRGSRAGNRDSGVKSEGETCQKLQSLFALELKILVLTLLKIVKMEGIKQPGRATIHSKKYYHLRNFIKN